MASSKPIDEKVIEDSIVKALQNVCRDMIRSNVFLVRSRVEATQEDGYHMMSNVGFAGAITGNVILCLSEEFAYFATGKVLGMSRGEIEIHGPEVLKDAIGEITNVTAGGFKNRLCDLGYPCKLSLPYIIRGRKFKVSTISEATRNIFEFNCEGHVLLADIQFRVD